MTKRRNKKSESKNDAKPKETKVEFLASLAGVLVKVLHIQIEILFPVIRGPRWSGR